MKLLPAFLMLALAVGFGQTAQTKAAKKGVSTPKTAAKAPAPAARWPVQSLAVEGNRIYTREQVLAVAGLKVGQMAGKPEFEAARERLVATGAFATVGYKFTPASTGEGYSATFQVSEFDLFYPVVFEDLRVSSRDLEAHLRAKDPLFSPEHVPATQPVLDRYAKWIQEYLASKGIQEKIAGNVEPSTPGDYVIEFHPTRNLPAVAEITFSGNQVLTQTALREAVSGAAVGSPYSENYFRQVLLASVRPLYEARGRLRVAFTEVRSEPVKDVNGVHVFINIDEGPVFELGKVSFDGPTPVAPESLLKTGDFKGGDIANLEKVNEGIEKVTKAVRRAGYMDAKVNSERRIDDGNHKVDIVLRVDPGPQYIMGKLAINGLDLVAEPQVRKAWALKEGKPFNPEYPEAFLNGVRNDFDNLGKTKSETKLNASDHSVDVTLTFGAAPPARGGGRTGGRAQ
jgi:outer membrane protein insertion porin family